MTQTEDWFLLNKRLTNDDDQNPSHYLKSQWEGNQRQNSNVVPGNAKEKVIQSHISGGRFLGGNSEYEI